MKKQGIVLAAALFAVGSYGDIFGTGENQFSIDFVNIGYAGNVADSTGYGAVGYNYRVGMYEITIDQYSKAWAADSRMDYNVNPETGSNMSDRDEAEYIALGSGAPATYINWYEATLFCNWLTSGDAYSGAYQFEDKYGNGIMYPVAQDRDAAVAEYGTVYVLPTEDEWYKAAYYNAEGSGYSRYANGSDDEADLIKGTAAGWNYDGASYADGSAVWVCGSGAEEQNGTYDMMGNLLEWTESPFDGELSNMTESRSMRGGHSGSSAAGVSSSGRQQGSTYENNIVGFRVAAIPEPSSGLLVMVGAGGIVFYRRAKERSKTQVPDRRHFE